MSLLNKVLYKSGLKKRDRFIIICHQRSGSNMMTGIMGNHRDVSFFGQVFKADAPWLKYLDSLGVMPFTGQLFDDDPEQRDRFDSLQDTPSERESRNTAEFVERYFETRSNEATGKYMGIKFHGGTLYTDEIHNIFLDKDYKVIMLHRENLLAAAVSWYRARTLDQWTSKSADDIKPTDIEMDIEMLEWFCQKTREDVALWQSLLKDRNHLELTYEQITAADFNFAKIWNHLNIEDIGKPAPKTKKLIKTYDNITNIEAIREHFKDKDYGMI
ncbi:MAG: sulfotransferase [Pricia sp.]